MGSDSTTDVAFYAVLGFLLGHELDAVERREWRLLPVLRALPERVAARLFVLLHVPLFVALFRLVAHPSARVRRRARLAVDAFAVVHAGLHVSFADHPEYEFDGALSRLLVWAAAAAGVAHAALVVLTDGETDSRTDPGT